MEGYHQFQQPECSGGLALLCTHHFNSSVHLALGKSWEFQGGYPLVSSNMAGKSPKKDEKRRSLEVYRENPL